MLIKLIQYNPNGRFNQQIFQSSRYYSSYGLLVTIKKPNLTEEYKLKNNSFLVLIKIAKLRAHLHETRSELKPVRDFTSG